MNGLFAMTGLAIALAVPAAALSTETPVLDGWRFHKGDIPGAEAPAYDDSAWESVRIPHDWAIAGEFNMTNDLQVTAIEQDGETERRQHVGRTGALPWPGVGWYRRKIEIPAGAKEAELVFSDGTASGPKRSSMAMAAL